MKIHLGAFADTGMDALLECERATAVGAALRRYARRIEAGRRPAAFPRFRANADVDCPVAEVDVALDERIRETLEHEARRQAISTEQLLQHAVIVYLAELDAASGAPSAASR